MLFVSMMLNSMVHLVGYARFIYRSHIHRAELKFCGLFMVRNWFTCCEIKLGYVGLECIEYCMLQLHQLVIKLFTKILGLTELSGVVA